MTEQTISERLQDILAHYDELSAQLADPEVFTNSELLPRYAREQAELAPLATLAQSVQQSDDDIALYSEMTEDGLDGSDMDAARAELRRLRAHRAAALEEARLLLVPREPND